MQEVERSIYIDIYYDGPLDPVKTIEYAAYFSSQLCKTKKGLLAFTFGIPSCKNLSLSL